MDQSGRCLWERQTNAFPFDLRCRDINGDGVDEILAALADGTLLVLNGGGEVLFSFRHPHGFPFYSIDSLRDAAGEISIVAGGVGAALFQFDLQGRLIGTHDVEFTEMIRYLLACDFDGKGAQSLIAGSSRMRAPRFIFWNALSNAPAWTLGDSDKCIGMDQAKWNLTFLPFEGEKARIAQVGGGKIEAERRYEWTEPASVRLIDRNGNAELLPITGMENFDLPQYVGHTGQYAMHITCCISWEGQPALADLRADRLIIIDDRGVARKAGTAQIGFSSIDSFVQDQRQFLLLGSSPNGDDNLYILPVDCDWTRELAALPRQGSQVAISKFIENTSAALRMDETLPPPSEPIDVEVRSYGFRTSEDIRRLAREIPEFLSVCRDRYQAPNIRFGVGLCSGHRTGRQMNERELIWFFEQLEASGSPWDLFASHGSNLGPKNQSWYIPMDLARKIIQVAPRSCMAFSAAENYAIESIPGWFDEYWQPIMEMCLANGSHVQMWEKNLFWALLPAMREFRERILNERYRKIFIPNTEDSNSRAPDVQLAARVGLWLSRVVEDWGTRIIEDSFSFNRQFQWEYPMVGHPTLRSMIAVYALGCRHLTLEHGQFGRFTGDIERERDFNRVWAESTDVFLRLISSGALRSPRREDLLTVSPVAIALTEPSARFAQSSHNSHDYQNPRPDDGGRYSFSRMDCYWGMTPTHPLDLSYTLYGRRRQFGNFIPRTPHGLVAIFPDAVPADQTPWARTRVVTNGDWLKIEGKEIPLQDSPHILRELMRDGAKKFPIACLGDEDVFFQLARIGRDLIQIVLIDPGYLDPAEHTVTLKPQVPMAQTLRDAVTNEEIRSEGEGWPIRVPAGGFRVLRAKIENLRGSTSLRLKGERG